MPKDEVPLKLHELLTYVCENGDGKFGSSRTATQTGLRFVAFVRDLPEKLRDPRVLWQAADIGLAKFGFWNCSIGRKVSRHTRLPHLCEGTEHNATGRMIASRYTFTSLQPNGLFETEELLQADKSNRTKVCVAVTLQGYEAYARYANALVSNKADSDMVSVQANGDVAIHDGQSSTIKRVIPMPPGTVYAGLVPQSGQSTIIDPTPQLPSRHNSPTTSQFDRRSISVRFQDLASTLETISNRTYAKLAHIAQDIEQNTIPAARLLELAVQLGHIRGGWPSQFICKESPGNLSEVWPSDNENERLCFLWTFSIGSWLKLKYPTELRADAGDTDWKHFRVTDEYRRVASEARSRIIAFEKRWRAGKIKPGTVGPSFQAPEGSIVCIEEVDFDNEDRLAMLRTRAQTYADACRLLARLVGAELPVAPVLTEGEKKVWEVLEGRAMTAAKIAGELNTSEQTVKEQIKSIRLKGRNVENQRGRGYFRPDAPPSE